jgi:hypothetical protein
MLIPRSEKPVMIEIYEGFLKLAEQEIYREKIDTKWFINNRGYYDRYNLSKAEMENPEYINMRAKNLASFLQTPTKIEEERDKLSLEHLAEQLSCKKAKEIACNAKEDTLLITKLSNFAGYALDYNESRRKVITRMFKYFSENP